MLDKKHHTQKRNGYKKKTTVKTVGVTILKPLKRSCRKKLFTFTVMFIEVTNTVMQKLMTEFRKLDIKLMLLQIV